MVNNNKQKKCCNIMKPICVSSIWWSKMPQFHITSTGNTVKPITTNLFILVKNAVHSFDQSLNREITRKMQFNPLSIYFQIHIGTSKI